MVDMRFPTHRFWWHVFHTRIFIHAISMRAWNFWVRFKSCDD